MTKLFDWIYRLFTRHMFLIALIFMTINIMFISYIRYNLSATRPAEWLPEKCALISHMNEKYRGNISFISRILGRHAEIYPVYIDESISYGLLYFDGQPPIIINYKNLLFINKYIYGLNKQVLLGQYIFIATRSARLNKIELVYRDNKTMSVVYEEIEPISGDAHVVGYTEEKYYYMERSILSYNSVLIFDNNIQINKPKIVSLIICTDYTRDYIYYKLYDHRYEFLSVSREKVHIESVRGFLTMILIISFVLNLFIANTLYRINLSTISREYMLYYVFGLDPKNLKMLLVKQLLIYILITFIVSLLLVFFLFPILTDYINKSIVLWKMKIVYSDWVDILISVLIFLLTAFFILFKTCISKIEAIVVEGH